MLFERLFASGILYKVDFIRSQLCKKASVIIIILKLGFIVLVLVNFVNIATSKMDALFVSLSNLFN